MTKPTTPRIRRAISPKPLVIAIAAGLTAAVPMVQAQDLMLEEVVVTAQKREQGLQDVPVAVSAVSGEKIDDIGITDFEEVTLYTPSVSINRGSAQPNIFIRGVGSGTNAGFEQSVGLYIDGVYSGRGQLAAVPMTMDLARIEILKGPQGILFGKNTIGGAINVTTAKPSFDFEGMVDALYAPEDGEQIYNLVLNTPISDNFAARLAMRYEGMDGWWDNRALNLEGPDKDNLFARLSLRWEINDNLEALFKYEHGDFDIVNKPIVVYQSDHAGKPNYAGGIPFPVIDSHSQGAVDNSAATITDTDTAALTLNWDLDFATLTSISAFTGYDLIQKQDSDFSAQPGLHRTLDEQYEQLSQEIRLVSPGGETFDWIVGAYYQQAELDVSRTNNTLNFALSGPLGVPPLSAVPGSTPKPSIFDQDSDSWAIFAQGTFAVSDSLRLGLGLRYNEETKELDKITGNELGILHPVAGFLYSNPANLVSITDLRSHSFTGLERSEEKLTWMA
ncbi:MAG: TonB-dependent receptor, partial [Cellvibrionaceae bacterium]|nr:TonB-dependent receptor [Cellvibrionaceae bacterium]